MHAMSDAVPAQPPSSARAWIKALVIVAVIALVVVALRTLPVKPALERFNAIVESLGVLGVAVFVAGYAVAALLFPASILTLGAGATFGPVIGTIAVSLGANLCAWIAFWIGRSAARGWVQRQMTRFPRFAAVERAVAMQGFKIVLLTRLSPAFPFTWQNYAYGVTNVRFRDYAIATALGMLPGTFAYVYLGYAAKTAGEAAASGESGSSLAWTLFKVAVVVVPALVVTGIIGRTAKKALDEAAATPPP